MLHHGLLLGCAAFITGCATTAERAEAATRTAYIYAPDVLTSERADSAPMSRALTWR